MIETDHRHKDGRPAMFFRDASGRIHEVSAHNESDWAFVYNWLGSRRLPDWVDGTSNGESADPRMITNLPIGHKYEDAA